MKIDWDAEPGNTLSRLIANTWRSPHWRRLTEPEREWFTTTETTQVSGQHSWGSKRALTTRFDSRKAWVSGFRTYIQPYGLVKNPHPFHKDLDMDRIKRPGFWQIEMPVWNDDRIGHPAGRNASPGELQWVTTPTFNLLRKFWPRLIVENAFLAEADFGYNTHLKGMPDLYKKLFAEFPDPEQQKYLKLTYSKGLMQVRNGHCEMYRPDIAAYVRGAVYAELWEKAWAAVNDGHKLVWMGLNDGLGFAEERGQPEDWPHRFGLFRTSHYGPLKLEPEDPTWLVHPSTRWAKEMRKNDAVIIDLETTDFKGYIMEIAVIDTDGKIVLHSYVNPMKPIHPDALKVHHITKNRVEGAPIFRQILPDLRKAIAGRPVVAYNVDFERQTLARELNRLNSGWDEFGHLATSWECAMRMWSDYNGLTRKQNLRLNGPHTALGDCQATLKRMKEMSRGAR